MPYNGGYNGKKRMGGVRKKNYRARMPPHNGTFVRHGTNNRTGGLMGIENKFLDTFANVAITAPTDAAGGEVDPPTADCLTAIPQGDKSSERIGKSVVVNKVTVRGTISVAQDDAQTETSSTATYMVAMILDTQTNAAQLKSEDVYKNAMADPDTACSVLRDMEFTNRFKVLRVVQLVAPTVWAAGVSASTYDLSGYTIPFEMHKEWKSGLKINYKLGAITGVIANTIDNSIHIIAYATNASRLPRIKYNARIRYTG